jgi:nicotinamide riboside transporter PnuC
MNRSLLIILIPTLLVATGYIVVLQMMGIAPAYLRLVMATVLSFGGLYAWSRWPAKKVKRGG